MPNLTHRIIIRKDFSKIFLGSSLNDYLIRYYFLFCGCFRLQNIVFLAKKIIKEQCKRDHLHLPFELSVVITDDTGIAKLNWQYRQKKGPTDVLSFPLIAFPNGPGTSELRPKQIEKILPNKPTGPNHDQHHLIGDVVISYETCIRQARQKSQGAKINQVIVARELLRLLVHGILHLFGYDHETNVKDKQRMQRREQELYDCL